MHAYTAGSISTDGTRTRLALVADDARGRLSSTSERLPPATEVYTVPGAPTSAGAPPDCPGAPPVAFMVISPASSLLACTAIRPPPPPPPPNPYLFT